MTLLNVVKIFGYVWFLKSNKVRKKMLKENYIREIMERDVCLMSL